MRPRPSRDRVLEVLNYDPLTGVFTRKIQTSVRINVGDIAGYVEPRGYRLIRVDTGRYYAHQLAWLILYGEWPTRDIDHRDRDKGNNAKSNLRLATRSENISNQVPSKISAAGFRGVRPPRRSARSRWTAIMQIEGRQVSFGAYDSAEAAARAWDRECIKRRGEFAVTNFPREQYS